MGTLLSERSVEAIQSDHDGARPHMCKSPLVRLRFASHLRAIRTIIENREIPNVYLDGSTRHREQVIDEFRTGDSEAFLISFKAGGSGLALIEADYVFMLHRSP